MTDMTFTDAAASKVRELILEEQNPSLKQHCPRRSGQVVVPHAVPSPL